MAILSPNPNPDSATWEIVLNRSEMEETVQRQPDAGGIGRGLSPISVTRIEPTLTTSDITISRLVSGTPTDFPLSSITDNRTSTTKTIVLQTAVPDLLPSQITISARSYPSLPDVTDYEQVPSMTLPSMTVLRTINSAYRIFIEPYLSQIRNHLRLDLTSDDVPDSTIEESSILRFAELQIYKQLGLTDSTYDQKAATDPLFQERARIALTYRSAALLLYACLLYTSPSPRD